MKNTKDITLEQYIEIMNRIEELMDLTDDDTDENDPYLIELDALIDKCLIYENKHYPIFKDYR